MEEHRKKALDAVALECVVLHETHQGEHLQRLNKILRDNCISIEEREHVINSFAEKLKEKGKFDKSFIQRFRDCAFTGKVAGRDGKVNKWVQNAAGEWTKVVDPVRTSGWKETGVIINQLDALGKVRTPQIARQEFHDMEEYSRLAFVQRLIGKDFLSCHESEALKIINASPAEAAAAKAKATKTSAKAKAEAKAEAAAAKAAEAAAAEAAEAAAAEAAEAAAKAAEAAAAEAAEAAAAEAAEAAAKAAEDAKAHNKRGILLKKTDLEGAEAEYRAALALNPKFVTAHYNLGLLLEEKSDFMGAKAEFRTALVLDPEHVRAQKHLDNLLKQNGDLLGAAPAEAAAEEAAPSPKKAKTGEHGSDYNETALEKARTQIIESIKENEDKGEKVLELATMYMIRAENAETELTAKRAENERLIAENEHLTKRLRAMK